MKFCKALQNADNCEFVAVLFIIDYIYQNHKMKCNDNNLNNKS